MKKQNQIHLGAFSQLDENIITRNAQKRALLLNRINTRRKLTAIISIAASFAILISTLSIFLISAFSKQVPIYRGMTVASENTAVHTNGTLVHPVFDNKKTKDNGYVDGDYNKKPDEIDQNNPFDDKKVPLKNSIGKSLVVEGATEDLYYANANEDVFITVHIDNPDSFEILSFTLNGYKYQNNMFEYGSDLENLILKVNVGDIEGIVDYTIDAIKYIDGDKIKDVRMSGDKTIKIGIATDKQPTATLFGETVSYTDVGFTASITDTLSLIGKQSGSIHAVLYDGETIMAKKELSVGEHAVTFTGLSENTLYQYAIVATYDDLNQNGVASHILANHAFMTKSSAPLLFDSITLTGTSTSFTFMWNEGVTPGTVTSLSLWQGDSKLRDLAASDTYVDGLLWGTEYTLKAEYTVNGKRDAIAMNFRTVSKIEPTVTIQDLTVGKTSIDFSLVLTDPDDVGNVTKVELYKGEKLVKESNSFSSVHFDFLEGETVYTVKVAYTYDLSNGNGEQTQTYEKELTTKELFNNGICVDDNGVTYKLNSDGTVSVTAYSGSAPHITIGLAGYAVTTIEAEVFRAAITLVTVTLPDSLLAIGDSAFAACSSLDYIVIPKSVTSIGYFAFADCTDTKIFCEADTQPRNWNNDWLGNKAKAYFAGKWGYVDSIPALITPIKNGLILKPYSPDALLYNKTTKDYRYHSGIDIIPTDDNNVYSVIDGTVSAVKQDNWMGLTVEITGENSVVASFMSLDTAFVKIGDTIRIGDIIGTVGTSASTEKDEGDHLHFEINPGNPTDYVQEKEPQY